MTNDKAANLSGATIEGNTFTNYPEPPVVETRQPAEVAAILEQAADHAGASASTYRQLAALMKDPRFAAGIPAPGGIDIAKALRDAHLRGWQTCYRTGRGTDNNAYETERDAWIRQYMARLPGAKPVDAEALRLKLEGALKENAELRKQISDIYNAQNG